MTDETRAAAPPTTAQDELKAMAAVDEAIAALGDQDTKQRVFDWVAGRHGLAYAKPGPRAADRVSGGRAFTSDESEQAAYADFASLYDAADPQNDRERLLVAGYWLQVRQKEQDLHADNVNEILIPLGHRIERVRDVLPGLLTGSPRLMIRVGKNKGARGRVLFRLSIKGVQAVEAALIAGGFGSAE